MNRFRISLLEQWLGDVTGWRVVDLGCGGGLLSEALAQRGARVIGVDLSRASLAAAHRAPSFEPQARLYAQGDLCQAPVITGSADLVLLADVVEHVTDRAQAVAEAARIARPGGRVYVNTITRSPLARFLAVTLAEGLGFVPAGTHDPRMFVRPEELSESARNAGLRLCQFQAEGPAVIQTLRRRALTMRAVPRVTAAYSALFEKEGPA